MSVKMYAPFSANGAQFIQGNGTPLTISGGYANVAEADVLTMLRHGFKIAVGQGSGMPDFRRTVATNDANCTLVANAMAFGKTVILVVSNAAAITATTETANNICALIPGVRQWDTWLVRVLNLNSGNLTLAGGANVAFNGTAVLGTNKYADFMAQVIDTGQDVGHRLVYYNVGSGNAV